MIRKLTSLLFAGGVALSAGCTSLVVGSPIDSTKVTEIIPGRTTTHEIETWFGRPQPGHLVKAEDGDIYVYRYLDGNGGCEELVISFSDDVVASFSRQ